jgi:signal transduction histidine kinase
MVTVWEAEGRLNFTIADGGQGFKVNGSPPSGGLANMRERIAGVDGILRSSRTNRTAPESQGLCLDRHRAACRHGRTRGL